MCWYIITGKFPSKLSANRTNTNQFTFKMCGSNYKTYQQCLLQLVLYPVVLWGYRLYVKWLVLVSPKILEFNASTLLEKALKALPSHFKFEQTFVFFCFLLLLFFWTPEFGCQYHISSSVKILLSTSLITILINITSFYQYHSKWDKARTVEPVWKWVISY